MARKRLAIVGAGPKAAAIAARAAVLREMIGKDRVPEVIVFDRSGVAAAWSGAGNFSSGFLTLCTPGEKDVGFPYLETLPSPPAPTAIGPALLERFSWGAYLVAVGRFAEWVDRERDHPTHADFANYLAWVFRQAGQEVVNAEVRSLEYRGEKWCIDRDRGSPVVVDGVVITGTGRPVW